MDKVRILLEEELIKDKNIPEFNVGDTVRVITKLFEQDKVRLSPFEGIVIAKKGSGIRSSFTVRRVSYGEGIERVFPVYSPHIEKIEVLQSAKTKRAKLYYLRKRIGRSASQV
jgi:large subunit ribosomal protein L19